MPNRRAIFNSAARPTGRMIVYSANGGYTLFGRYGVLGGTAILILLAIRIVYFFHLQKYFYQAAGQHYSDLTWSDQRKQKRYLAEMNDKIARQHWWEAYRQSEAIDRSIHAYSDHPRLRAEFLLPIDQLGQQAKQDFENGGATAIRNALKQYMNLCVRHPIAAYNAMKAVQPQADELGREDPAAQYIALHLDNDLSMARTVKNMVLAHRQEMARIKAKAHSSRPSPKSVNGPSAVHPMYHPAAIIQPAQSSIFAPLRLRPEEPAANTPVPQPQPQPQPQGPPPAPVLSSADRHLLALRSNPVFLGANRRATELVNVLSRQIDHARSPWRGISDRTHTAAELLGIYVNLRGLAANEPLNVKLDDQLRQLNGHLSAQDNPIEGSIFSVQSQCNILAIWAAQRAKGSGQFAARYQALGAAGKCKLLVPSPIPQIQADYATENRRVLALFELAFAGRPGNAAAVTVPALLQPQAAATTVDQRKAMAAQRRTLQVLLTALAQKDNAMAQVIANKVNGALPRETSAIVVQEDYLQGIVWCLQYMIRDM